MMALRKRRRSVRRWLVRGLLVTLALAALCGGAWVVVLAKTGKIFVADVNVTGASRLSDEEILDAAGLTERVGIFTIDPATITKDLLGHPWIRSARVRRVLPTRVDVTIRERVAVALLEAGDSFLVDDEGTAFIKATPRALEALGPVARLTLPRRDSAELDREPEKRLVREGLLLARDVARLFPHWTGKFKVLLHPVLGPRLLHPQADSARSLVETRIGRGRWGEKLTRLKLLLEQAAAERRRLELVILDNERHPDRVTARFAAGG
ncbi:MAG: FtsQ-type POTRA domain-containing protein [Deltaproteobacteria bacterium]|nr:FtsQ-type POTRA domain-containing protein [Deltaproteobacteria bacterium]